MQEALIACPIEDVFFGGARGGGKTDGTLGDWISHQDEYKKLARGIFFRRTYDELEEAQARAVDLFTPLGGVYKTQKRTWVFPSGASLKMRILLRDEDAGKYQGHSYCVGKGTPVLMADGSYRAIEDIRMGDFVMTLEGPHRVNATMPARRANCVMATVYDALGKKVGSQIHPASHPFLTSAETPLEACRDSYQSGVQSQTNLRSWQDYESLLHENLGNSGGDACTTSSRSDCKVFEDERLAVALPVRLNVPVVLYSPSHRSSARCLPQATQCRSRGKSKQSWFPKAQETLRSFGGRLPRLGLSESLRGRGVLKTCGALAYALHANRTIQGSQGGCRSYSRSYDEQLHLMSGCGQDAFPSLSGAEAQGRAAKPLGDTGNTLGCNHWQPDTYSHPYTKEIRHLRARVELGSCELIPIGVREVYDLNIDIVNHYITDTGLINKNTWICFEELTNWPESKGIDKLRACLRSGKAPIPKSLRATGNPGGPGHNWVKARYIDPAPPMQPFYDEDMQSWRVFIPSKLEDNKALTDNDPDYWKRVVASANGNEALIRAWGEGDWDIVAGGMFDDLWKRDRHVIAPFQIPHSWKADRSFDWGSSKPFSVGWWAESDGTVAPNGLTYPRGTLFRIAEWYGCARKVGGGQKPNEGLKMLAVDVAKGVKNREGSDAILKNAKVRPGPADTQIFDIQNGVCIAEDMRKHGVNWLRADKSPGSRKTGWERIRKYLKAARDFDDEPGMYIFNTCVDFIRTVPVLPRDTRDSDDVDTDAEDHVGDETRYRILRRAGAGEMAEEVQNALAGWDDD